MNSACLRRLRDSEGKGVIGCLAALVLLGFATYAGIILGPIYYSNYNFESDVKTEASRAGAHFFDDETVVKDIIDLGRRNDIRLERTNIKIDRFAGQVHIDVNYAVPVDFIVIQKKLGFTVTASSFVGVL